jgi:predicted amidohydrolase
LAIAASAAPAGRFNAAGCTERLAERAGVAGADLLLLPFRGREAPIADAAAAEAVAEPSDGPTAARMAALAARTGVAILFGYVEHCSGRRHDSLQLVDAGGHSLANYRRAHLEGDRERQLFSPGHWLAAMPLHGHQLGMLGGFDLAFPEAARALRLIGCDLLLVAGGGNPARESVLAPARAIENGFHVALAGPVPCLIGPSGERVGELLAGGELLMASVPPMRPGHGSHIIAARRPRLYQRLVAVDEVIER